MTENNKEEEKKTNALQDLIGQFNGKISELANKIGALAMWVEQQLKLVQRQSRAQAVQVSVQDVGLSSIIKVLIEKGIMTDEEYKDIVQVVYLDLKNSEEALRNLQENEAVQQRTQCFNYYNWQQRR